MAAPTDDGDDLLEVGHITKPHGLRGEVVVRMVSDRAERVAPGACLSTDDGDLVVSHARAHQDRWVVTFEGVSTREAAEELRGTRLRAAPLPSGPDELWVHELVGCEVRTLDGVARGTVDSVVDNPAADLLALDTGPLVPVVFVVDGPTGGVVVVDTPDGLFELWD